ncbi:MAG TPA: zinc ribbon domain-containing protein, partial [Candidatus Eremiobacteraeota bacterium]|nr:zinc ribbon domain-containing protein [Candidatus Eremiobacteraeota bacterium]
EEKAEEVKETPAEVQEKLEDPSIKSKLLNYLYLCPGCNTMNKLFLISCCSCGDDLVKLRKSSLPHIKMDPVSKVISLLCPNCETINNSKATFCKSCGINFMEMASICPKCNVLNRVKSKFCKHCGEKVRKIIGLRLYAQLKAISLEHRECPQCKHKNRLSAKFCKKCGFTLIKISEKVTGIQQNQEISYRDLSEELKLIELYEDVIKDRLIQDLDMTGDMPWPTAKTQVFDEEVKVVETQEDVKHLEKFLQDLDVKIKESVKGSIVMPLIKQKPLMSEKATREYEEAMLRDSILRNKEFLASLFSKHRSAKQDMENLSYHIQEVRGHYEEFKANLKKYKDSFYEVQNSLTLHEEQLSDLESEIEERKNELNEVYKLEKTIDRAYEDIKIFKQKYIEARSERRNIESKIRRAEAEKNRITKLLEKGRLGQEEYKKKVESFDKEILSGNKSLKLTEAHITDYKNEIDRLSELSKGSKQSIIRDLEKNLVILNDNAVMINEKIDFYKEFLKKAEGEVNHCKLQAEKFDSELKILMEEEIAKRGYIEDLEKQMKAVKAQIAELDKKLGRDTIEINLDDEGLESEIKISKENVSKKRETREISTKNME